MPFRAWVQGISRGAGSIQTDAVRNITGAVWDFPVTFTDYNSVTGAFGFPAVSGSALFHTKDSTIERIGPDDGVSFDASRVVPTADENRPTNIAVPFILYLGLSV